MSTILKNLTQLHTSRANSGTFVYLANSTNGATVRSAGVELGQIFKDGTHSFDISQLNNAIGLNDYKYVIILCKPASVTFGFAELK